MRKLLQRNRDKLILILIALAMNIVFCIPLYKEDLFYGIDLSFHAGRIEGVVSAIRDGQFPLAIYPNKNFGFGYASPLFYCDLFFLFPALLYSLGISLINSYKIFLFFVSFAGIISMLYVTQYFSKKQKYLPFILTAVYTFSAYRYNDFFLRAAFGESIAFTFIPLLFLEIYKLIEEHQNNYLSLGLVFAVILLSHVITFAICCVIFGIICLINIRDLIHHKQIRTILFAIALAIGMTAFYLFPMLEQMLSQQFWMNYVNRTWGQEKMIFGTNTILQALDDYLFSTPADLTQYRRFVGLPILISLFSSFIFMKGQHRFIKQMTVIDIILFLMTTDLLPIYKISLFSNIQFPFRLYTQVTCFSILILEILLEEKEYSFSKWVVGSLLLLTAVSNIKIYTLTLKNENMIASSSSYEEIYHVPYDDEWYFYNEVELAEGEYLPFTLDQRYDRLSGCILLAEGQDYVCDFEREGTDITFRSDYDDNKFVMMPLSWYKGYMMEELDEDGTIIRKEPCIFNEDNKLVQFKIEPGKHIYHIYYSGTKIQKISAVFSILSAVSIIYLNIRNKSKRKMRQQVDQ